MNKKLLVTGGNGIQIQYDGMKIALDPIWKTDASLTFVSHAHLDHACRNPGPGRIVASKETVRLLNERGFDYSTALQDHDGIRLYDSGHMVGSKGILIDGAIYYTGDIAGRPRAFLKEGEVPRARTLIMESTYGKPEFRFPKVDQIARRTKAIIEEAKSQNRPVVLMGYPLGKSQVLTSLFQKYAPIYLHGSVTKANEACLALGVDLPTLETYAVAKARRMLEKRDWVLISPVYSGRSSFLKNLKQRYGAVSVSYTGWALHPSYKYAMAVDHALALSDHCDFEELVALVRKCEPEEVFVTHGFRSEFAGYLSELGFKARALDWRQRPLSDFIDAA